MTPIAIELDQKIQSFDPETSASVERLVRDTLQLAEKKTRQSVEGISSRIHPANGWFFR